MNRAIAIEGFNRMTWIALALVAALVPTQAVGAVAARAGGSGRTLTVVGDRDANEVTVLLDVDGDAIEVSEAGVPVGRFAASPVESIRVRTSGGNDSLSVQLLSGGRLALRSLSINLGGGDDFAAIGVDPGVALSVIGGSGEDGVSTQASTDGFRAVENVMTWTALLNNGTGPRGLGYSCTNGECTCDKSIENDCEDMTGECRDEDIDTVIRCIEGWLTTHCACKQAAQVWNPGGIVFQPIDGGLLTR